MIRAVKPIMHWMNLIISNIKRDNLLSEMDMWFNWFSSRVAGATARVGGLTRYMNVQLWLQ